MKREDNQYEWKKVMSAKDVVRQLESNGWVLDRQRGSHLQYLKNGIVCTVPNHK